MNFLNHRNQRVGIFIDTQNLYHSAKHIYQAKVNFKVLVSSLTRKRQLIRAIAYVIRTEDTAGEKAFFEALQKENIELRAKELQVYPNGVKKGDWDVGIAVDAIRMAPSFDVIILVTGDGDFVPLVEYLKWGLGKKVEVAAFSKTCSTVLRESAELFIQLERIPKILIRR